MKQGTLTRPEHLVPPPRHNALMFAGSTSCELDNNFRGRDNFVVS